MTLAQIESAEENDALRVALGDLHLNGHDYWIGLERAQTAGIGLLACHPILTYRRLRPSDIFYGNLMNREKNTIGNGLEKRTS